MHRRGFLRALAGVLAAAPAATALVLRAPQHVEKFRPQVQDDQFVGRVLAFEFLRILNHELAGIERSERSTTLHSRETRLACQSPWFSPQQVGVNIEWKPELGFDKLCEEYVRPAALSIAEHMREERQRGAGRLQFVRLAQAQHGPTICEVVTALDVHTSARMCVATWPLLIEDEVFEWLTFARFDVAYWWEQPPRRKRRRYALDPARLPA
jgi:hypothetical protein